MLENKKVSAKNVVFFFGFLLQCGSMLFAQLEIWKAAVEESPRNTLAASWSPPSGISGASNSVSVPSSATVVTNPIGASGSAAAGSNTSCAAIEYSEGKHRKIYPFNFSFILENRFPPPLRLSFPPPFFFFKTMNDSLRRWGRGAKSCAADNSWWKNS